MTKKKLKTKTFCCERFKESYERGEVSYSYEQKPDIDETEWHIAGFYHLYFCPFCGAFIKGHGFGDYDKKYPPTKGVRTFKQKNTA
jgi:hypothetical protein